MERWGHRRTWLDIEGEAGRCRTCSEAGDLAPFPLGSSDLDSVGEPSAQKNSLRCGGRCTFLWGWDDSPDP
jgi:hypothetical protein